MWQAQKFNLVNPHTGQTIGVQPVSIHHHNYNNNNRELTECFWNLKVLYNLKKNIQHADTHNYTNQEYTRVQNMWKLTNIFMQNMAKTHTHKIVHTSFFF